jgi:hypothetical protein
MARPYGNGLDAELPQVRVTPEVKEAVVALAKARHVSAGELVRQALDQHLAKSGRPGLTNDQREQVVEKAAPAVAEALAELDAVRESVEGVAGRLGALEAAGR